MKLPTLYKRNKTGSIQEWTIEIDGNKYRTIYGQVGGALIEGDWTVCDSKNLGRANSTTPEQQALAQAKSLHTKQIDKNYVSDLSKVDTLKFKPPMLAKDYTKLKAKPEFPVFCQPKLDGIRCVATKDGLFTRNGKPIAGVPHIEKFLERFFELNPDAELDGELYNHKLKDHFEKIVSMVRKANPSEDNKRLSADLVEYWVYDVRQPGVNFSDRLEFLKKKVSNYYSRVRVVWTHTINDQEKLDEVYGEYLADGFEGQMIRTDTPYEFVRSKALLKRKEFMDAEFTVIEVLEGEGKRTGIAGAVRLKDNKDNIFKSSIEGDMSFCAKLLQDKEKYVGKVVTVRFQNYTDAGIPRFPYTNMVVRDYD